MLEFSIGTLLFTVTPLKVGIVLCASVLVSIIYRFLFAHRRDEWFRRTKSTIINQRGPLGNYISLGYPVTFKGLLVTLAVAGDCILIALIVFYIDF